MPTSWRLIVCFAALLSGVAWAQQAQSWTSHDKLALTYFFYWYDAAIVNDTWSATNHLTLHPPDSYRSDFSYDNVVFFQRELTDMVAAGIDVVLPVYWGDPGNSERWGVPGLQLMVQAEQGMARSGQTAPRIGMFIDTTSLQAANGGAKPDLTTEAGKKLFYGQINTFFSNVPKPLWAMIDGKPILAVYSSTFVGAYDQSTFDYVNQHFQQDFGVTPYIIRHPSWLGIQTDALYAGWPTWYNATFAGDVASVSPGHDNYGIQGPAGRHNVIDRNCGDLYQRDWDQVLSRGARMVLVENWNELFEGSGVSATKEYGRRYIDQTAANIGRWKSLPDPVPSSPSVVWASLGPQIYQAGLYTPINSGGAAWFTTLRAGHDAMYPDHSSSSNYIYLAVDDRFLVTHPETLWVTVEYLDTGETPWRLEYDGVSNAFTATAAVASQNTGLWKLHSFQLGDANFEKRESPNTDFRIDDYNTKGVAHYFNRVWLTKSAPYGQPPQMPLLPDIAVQAGSSVDIPVNALDASGKPLPVSLGLGPSFVSIQGKPGAQMIHVAPSLADVRSCADVTGPGVTSAPAYKISVVADDPKSLPSTGATMFSVEVSATPLTPAQINDGGVKNGASFLDPMAPGSIATIFGTNLVSGSAIYAASTPLPVRFESAGGPLWVTVNGVPAPLFYADPTQINFLIPNEIPPGPAAVVVLSNYLNSNEAGITVLPNGPGIFVYGDNLAVAQNPDHSINGPDNPAKPGDYLVVYATGGGAVDNPVPSGTPAPVPPPLSSLLQTTKATIGGQNAEVAFAGLAPYFVGLTQFNVQVPLDLADGNYPIQVTINGVASNSPTISVAK